MRLLRLCMSQQYHAGATLPRCQTVGRLLMLTSQFSKPTAPHLHRAPSVRFIMSMVLLALLPATALHVYFFGPGLLVQFILAASSGLITEAIALRLRGKPIKMFITDGSA